MKTKDQGASAVAEPVTPAPRTTATDGLEPQGEGGAIIRGTVISRTRREVKNNEGRVRFNITVVILAGTNVYNVSRWSDVPLPPDLPVVGQKVEVPVRLGTFMQGGVPKTRLEWADSLTMETF